MSLIWKTVLLLGIYRKDLTSFNTVLDILASIQGVVIQELYLPGLISSNENQDVNIDCQYSIEETEADTQVKLFIMEDTFGSCPCC